MKLDCILEITEEHFSGKEEMLESHKISWNSLNKGRSRNSSHFPKFAGKHKMKIKSSFIGLIPILILASFGLVVALCLIGLLNDNIGLFGYVIGISFGSFWLLSFVGIIISKSTPLNLDLKLGFFWVGHNKLLHPPSQHHNNHLRIERIHAIQIVSHKSKQRVKFGPCECHEINFVLKDATRINVMGSRNIKRIIKSAAHIAEFLDIPVWDAM